MNVTPLEGKSKRSVQLAIADINIWEGSVRSGKTVGSMLAWIDYVLHAPDGDLLMVGKTERTLKRNIIEPIKAMLGPRRCRYVAGEGELWICGRRIYLVGANNAEAVGKIQGMTLAGAYVDEAALIPESFWKMLLTRLSVEGARLFGTSNPDNPTHWLMRDFLTRARLWIDHDGTERINDQPNALDLHRFSFNLDDNKTLPAKYVANLKAMFSGLWYKRFILGLWVIADGVIWDMWDETRHVIDDVPPIVEWALCVDYGTAGVFAAHLLGRADERRTADGVTEPERLIVAAEWRWEAKTERRQMTDTEYSAALRTWLADLETDETGDYAGCSNLTRIDVDPSATSFINQLHRDGWTRIHGADNAVADGIRTVASLLSMGRMFIHRSCVGLRQEIPGYVWDEKAAKLGDDKPVKANDHSCDATRYGVMGARRWWRHWLADAPPVADPDQQAA